MHHHAILAQAFMLSILFSIIILKNICCFTEVASLAAACHSEVTSLARAHHSEAISLVGDEYAGDAAIVSGIGDCVAAAAVVHMPSQHTASANLPPGRARRSCSLASSTGTSVVSVKPEITKLASLAAPCHAEVTSLAKPTILTIVRNVGGQCQADELWGTLSRGRYTYDQHVLPVVFYKGIGRI